MLTSSVLGTFATSESRYNDKIVDVVKGFVIELNESDNEYEIWKLAVPKKAYDLYSFDFSSNELSSAIATLYYMNVLGVNIGYIILDKENSIIEFSLGEPAFDNFLKNTRQVKDISVNNRSSGIYYIYTNGIPGIYDNGSCSNIFQSGELTEIEGSRAYDPQGMGNANCIVAAIGNLMWHWKSNGYPLLTTGLTFSQVLTHVDAYMVGLSGKYSNANIPSTIRGYVNDKSSLKYSATVTNVQNPTFSNVTTETVTNSRPCLLGFAAGSDYSKTVGHMTVCVGTRSVSSINYVKVMDGWSTSVVEKVWSSYNDFISKTTLSK
jgi:hypothetical protein